MRGPFKFEGTPKTPNPYTKTIKKEIIALYTAHMEQISFFGEAQVLAALSQKGDPLV
jgi:hypothetical protein